MIYTLRDATRLGVRIEPLLDAKEYLGRVCSMALIDRSGFMLVFAELVIHIRPVSLECVAAMFGAYDGPALETVPAYADAIASAIARAVVGRQLVGAYMAIRLLRQPPRGVLSGWRGGLRRRWPRVLKLLFKLT